MNHSTLVPTTQLLVNVFLSLPRQPASQSQPPNQRDASTREIFPSAACCALPSSSSSSSSYNYPKISFRSRQPVHPSPIAVRTNTACGAPLNFPPPLFLLWRFPPYKCRQFLSNHRSADKTDHTRFASIRSTPKRVLSPPHQKSLGWA